MSVNMHEKREQIDYDEAIRVRGTVLKKVHYAIAIFYLAALLMNARGLYSNAKLMRYGMYRDICISLIKPIAEAPVISWFSAPREKLEELIY